MKSYADAEEGGETGDNTKVCLAIRHTVINPCANIRGTQTKERTECMQCFGIFNRAWRRSLPGDSSCPRAAAFLIDLLHGLVGPDSHACT